MENVEYILEEVKKVVATGVFPLDGLRMSEEEKKKKIFDMLEKDGYDLGDRSSLEISYDGADNFDDGMSTKFVVTRKSLGKVPYEVAKDQIFAGTFLLDDLKMSDIDKRKKVYEMMEIAGVDVPLNDEVEINYDGAGSYEDGMMTNFRVYKVSKRRLEDKDTISINSTGIVDLKNAIIDDDLAPKEVTIQEVEMKEIVSGTINVEGLNSQEEIDKKVIELLNTSELKIDEVGELNFTYGDVTPDGEMPFSVAKVIVEDVKYLIEKKLIGTGFYKSNGDIYAEIQKSYGLDIRNDPNYEIIYGMEKDNKREYKLVRIRRKRLGAVKEDYQQTKLEASVDEFKNALDSVNSLVGDKEKINILKEKEKRIEAMSEDGMTENLKHTLDELNSEIRSLQNDLKRINGIYEESLAKMQRLMKEELDKLEGQGILSDEELVKFREEFVQQRLDESFSTVSIKKDIQLMKRELTSLIRKRNLVEREVLRAQDLRLSVKEYKEIQKVLAKKKITDAILESNGFGDIIAKQSQERTKEEKQALKNAKDAITSEIADSRVSNSESNTSILEMIDALYNVDTKEIMQQGARKIKENETVLDTIRSNATGLPEKIVTSRNVANNYAPLEAPKDMVEVMEARNGDNSINEQLEKIVLYKNAHDNSYYARENVFKRFNSRKQGAEIKIGNASYYKLNNEDLDFIVGNANNDYSPYVIEEKEITIENSKNVDTERKAVQTRDVKELFNSNDDTMERITIFVDLEHNSDKYVRRNVVDRFNIRKHGEEVRINNLICYKISDVDAEAIAEKTHNDYSPYEVVMQEVHFNGKKGETDGKNESIVEKDSAEVEHKTIIIYRDVNDDNQLYVSSAILNKFHIKPEGKMVRIKGKNCYKIDDVTDEKLNKLARESKNPIYDIKYQDVKLKKKKDSFENSDNINNNSKPHIEAILDKLTNGLDIYSKDCKIFTASNVHVANNFKSELQSGNVLYNIVHFVPTVIKSGVSFIRKMAAKLMLSKRANDSMNELKRRLYEDLSEEEIDVLFEEYRGSQLKTNMNNQINDLILDRLKYYGLKKTLDLNNIIKENYGKLFNILGQIKAIEGTLNKRDLDDKMCKSLQEERKKLIDAAAKSIKEILVSRKDANNLLSGGGHGLEEDFKAVATKLSYVGMRFGKNNNFDNELQHILGEYGQGLNDALAEADNEAIVDNFMGLESCYYDNTKVAKSIFGKRSVGDKYYSPLVEQFDYRDDPFIRDACVTFTTVSAGISALESFRVHQLESRELLKTHQEEVKNINSANDEAMKQIHQIGSDIENRREVFGFGMKAQSHQDVLNSANAIERAELDMSDWKFTDFYHAADKQGHEFFNGFHQRVSEKISDITEKYGVDKITQTEALQELANVANDAQATLKNVSSECLTILNDYAKSHPQFDLTAMKESLDYIVDHPDEISNMNNAMVDVTNLAGGLQGAAASHLTALEYLPSDMASTIVCAAGAAALALNVSNTMNKKYMQKKGYENEITEMMNDYLETNDGDMNFDNSHSK